MNLNRGLFFKTTLIVVAVSFLLYTIYQSITTTLFVAHFPTVIVMLPQFITSSQPTLQLGLFLFQEIAGSIGSYLRLIAAIIAVGCAILYFNNNPNYIGRLKLVLLFESLYFLLLLPAAANHLIGSALSTSDFLNFYTGASCLFQAILIFPALFILSRKLKDPPNLLPLLKWARIAMPLYVFGFWIRHVFLWVYALSSSANPQSGLLEAVGFVSSWLMLLVAAIVTTVICLVFMQTQELKTRLIGGTIILFGLYFIIYDIVAIWVPVYHAFLPLTDFWMITLPILGIAVLLLYGKRDCGIHFDELKDFETAVLL